MAVVENDVLMKFKDSSGNINLLYPITRKDDVDGLIESIRDQSVTTSGDGSAYTATVEGIASLSAGVSFVMIPHVESASTAPTLNVNNLGAKLLRRRVSSSIGTTTSGISDDWLSAGKPVNVMYDGTFWVVDLPRPNANDIMGAVAIQNGGTGATTAENARVNLGIETTDGTVTSGNADYAEVGEWTDGNPDSEDRIGYFVCIDLDNPGIVMKKATSSDDVRGVTVSAPAFSGGCSSDKFDSNGALLPKYNYVAVMGIVPVIDNGTCSIGGRCMPGSDSTAVPVDGDYGYQVMERVDDTHVLIAVEPGADYQYKFKNYVDNKVYGTSNYADSSVTTSKISSSSVTRAKLANDSLYSPLKSIGSVGTITISKYDIGQTIVADLSTVDFTINFVRDTNIPRGAEVAIFRQWAKTINVVFGSNVAVAIAGNSNYITAPKLTIDKFTMIALKKIVSDSNKDYWLLTGDAEVVS